MFSKMITDGRLDPNTQMEIDTRELHERRDERRKMQYLSSRSWEELSQIEGRRKERVTREDRQRGAGIAIGIAQLPSSS
jgi:hypothetical protein